MQGKLLWQRYPSFRLTGAPYVCPVLPLRTHPRAFSTMTKYFFRNDVIKLSVLLFEIGLINYELSLTSNYCYFVNFIVLAQSRSSKQSLKCVPLLCNFLQVKIFKTNNRILISLSTLSLIKIKVTNLNYVNTFLYAC